MNKYVIILSILLASNLYAQNSKRLKESRKFQQNLNKEFSSKEQSPLSEEDLDAFKGLEFFPIDSNFIVTAKLTFHKNSKPFQMTTTTDRLPVYKLYATARFELNGKPYSLEIYQNEKLLLTPEFEDYLFLPFTDQTNGTSSYGGGRYIDLNIPKSDVLVIDFNKAYNPYCAYNKKYSCPIPPKANHLATSITAGVKKFNP